MKHNKGVQKVPGSRKMHLSIYWSPWVTFTPLCFYHLLLITFVQIALYIHLFFACIHGVSISTVKYYSIV